MAILSNGKFYGFLCSVKETGRKLANGVKEYVEDFVSGFTGHGWRLWEYVKGKWKLEIDTIVVRETMLVFEMLVSKIRAIIGAQTISQGHGKVKSAYISDDGTEYLIELEDEDMSIVAHDFVRCQTFVGDKTKLYHVEVSSVDVETKTLHVPLTEFDKDESGNVLYPPGLGDELVQFGNSQNKARQSAIYMHADETGQPAIDVMFDVDSKNWDGKVKVRMGGDIPGGNGLKGFYSVNGMVKAVDDKGAVIYELSPDGSVNLGKGNIVYSPTTNKVTLGSGVTLTWNNLDSESKENLKGEPGKDGMRVYITYHDSEEEPAKPVGDGTTNGWHTEPTKDVVWISQKVAENADSGEWGNPIRTKGEDAKPGQDANLLPWVEDWDNNKTQIGSTSIISPKIFAGANTGTSDEPVLTGIAIGRGVLSINGVYKTGLFGLKDGKITFGIDAETGEPIFKGKIISGTENRKHIEISPETSDIKIFKSDGEVSAIFDGNEYASLDELFSGTAEEIVIENIPVYEEDESDGDNKFGSTIGGEKNITNLFQTKGNVMMSWNGKISATLNIMDANSSGSVSISVYLRTYKDERRVNLLNELLLMEIKLTKSGEDTQIVSPSLKIPLIDGYHQIWYTHYFEVGPKSKVYSKAEISELSAYTLMLGYVSQYFANGMALGSSNANLFSVLNTQEGRIASTFCNDRYGLKFDDTNLLSKRNGRWGILPSIICCGRITAVAGKATNTKLSAFDGRTELAVYKPGTGYVRIVLPPEWRDIGVNSTNCYIMLTGIGRALGSTTTGGDSAIKTTMLDWDGQSIYIGLSDDATANDGDFYFEIKSW